MENKDTVIDAKIGNLNELTKVLSVKEQAQEQLLVAMQALDIGTIVRNPKLEKVQGYTLTSLFITLLIVRLWGCLLTVAARQTADFSTKVWSHLLCDADDYDMPDLCQTFFRRALIRPRGIDL